MCSRFPFIDLPSVACLGFLLSTGGYSRDAPDNCASKSPCSLMLTLVSRDVRFPEEKDASSEL